MSDMIEKVARKLHWIYMDGLVKYFPGTRFDFDDPTYDTAVYFNQAEAAVKVMLEPTEAMVSAALQEQDSD